MKKLILTMLLCAGVGLTMSAAQSLGENARRQVGNPTGQIEAQASETAGVSIQQFMRQHGVSPGDNPLAKKSPQRISVDNLTGEKIASINVFKENTRDGNADKTPENKVWMANLIAGDTEDEIRLEDFCVIDYYDVVDSAGYTEDFFGFNEGLLPINLPIQVDFASGAAVLRSEVPYYHDEALGSDPIYPRWKVKKYTDVFIVPQNESSPDEAITGTIYEDGSMIIEGCFMLRLRLVYKSWMGSAVEQDNYDYYYDTVFVDSPVYSDLYLLTPNGIHEYEKASRFIPSGDQEGHHFTTLHDVQWGSFIGGTYDPNGIGGKKPIKPGSGGSGDINIFTPPGCSGSGSLFSSNPGNGSDVSLNMNRSFNFDLSGHFFRFIDLIDSSYDPNGIGGKRPIKPGAGDGDDGGNFHFIEFPVNPGAGTFSSGNPGNDPLLPKANRGNSDETNTYYQPVYMFQIDDTVYVCNLFGKMLMNNYMLINSDGTMTFPKQVIDKSAFKNAYNYSPSETGSFTNNLIPGCTGQVTADSITWDITVPYINFLYRFSYNYTNNRLYFTNGLEFMLGEMLNITAVTRKINEAMEGKASITDVTTLINRSLNQR